MIIFLPIPIGLIHTVYQEMAKREAKNPHFELGEPTVPGVPTLPVA